MTKSVYKWVALALLLIGVSALLFGFYFYQKGESLPICVVLFGVAAVFLFLGIKVVQNNRKKGEALVNRIAEVEVAVQIYLDEYDEILVPSCYAHPVTIFWMTRVIREGRAVNESEALELVKEDLKRLNADVQVSQEEYERIVAIKPLFLRNNYEMKLHEK